MVTFDMDSLFNFSLLPLMRPTLEQEKDGRKGPLFHEH